MSCGASCVLLGVPGRGLPLPPRTPPLFGIPPPQPTERRPLRIPRRGVLNWHCQASTGEHASA
eukprot:13070714-Alexandrium_andersonii.AAC.1